MFENALVGIDGTRHGRDAVALAQDVRDPDGRLALAFVRAGRLEEDLRESQDLLEKERDAAEVKAQLLSVLATSPGRGLHEQAEAQGADLLVVGSSGRGILGRAMLGDDTRAALNGTPCAVAVAATGYAERENRLRKVGVAYNGSPESMAALVLAKALAAARGATVHALEVVSLPPVAYGGMLAPGIGDYIDELVGEAAERMKQLPGVDGRAVYGLAGEELAAFGDELDILIVGSRGYGPLRRFVAGSTSDYLERHGRCSLLVLPRSAAT